MGGATGFHGRCPWLWAAAPTARKATARRLKTCGYNSNGDGPQAKTCAYNGNSDGPQAKTCAYNGNGDGPQAKTCAYNGNGDGPQAEDLRLQRQRPPPET